MHSHHHHQKMNIFDNDVESEGYTESSSTDYQDDIEYSYDDHAQNILSNLDQSIGRLDDYLAYERGFARGDIIYSIEDPSGQMGQVMDLDVTVDLESTSGEIIKAVNSKKLCKLRAFGEGDYVINGSWLGRVVSVYDLVTVLLDDGTKCKISTRDQDNIVPISASPSEGPCFYHLGQRVTVNYSTSFKLARWFYGTWTDDLSEGTVCKVEAGSVDVKWIASLMAASNTAPPPCLQNVVNLKFLSCIPYAKWELGDWCKLSPDYFQCPTTDGDHDFSSIESGHVIEMKKLGTKDHGCEKMFVITKTKTKVGVLWQDGNLTSGLEVQTLLPVNTIGDHDFWPEQFVLEKTISEDVENVHDQQFGIVKNVYAEERLVKVKWVTPEHSCSTDDKGDADEEIVSAYELVEHPDYSYCLGDVVFRMLPNFESSQVTLDVEEDRHNDEHGCPLGSDHFSTCQWGEERLVKDQILGGCDDYTYCYLSRLGTVTGFKDGDIEVRWASGIISKVKPSEIVGIEKFDTATITPSIHGEETVGSFVEEMPDEEETSFQNKGKELDFNDSREDCIACSLLCFPLTTIKFIMNFATRYFGFHASNSLSYDYTDVPDRNCNSYVESNDLESTESFNQFDKKSIEPFFKTEDVVKQASMQMNLEVDLSVKMKNMFKKFDTVDDYSDHHFAGTGGKDFTLSQVKRSWFKKVQQEWSILEKHLPDTIYVRVYEERMDLLRASIVGAAGTPYEDALFFFDICFPPEYPHEPPLVHYISGGLHLNPNLYESGRVCLSLLKTWTGTGTEVWNPESSSILQVLLSLQAIVLNDKPYFNEAGYDKLIGRTEGERNSITYNENAFLLSRKSIMYHLHKSPKHFEELVEEHFASRSHQILQTCKAHIDGTRGGLMAENQRTSSSTGFKIMLQKLLPMLLSAFTEKGVKCNLFLNHQPTPHLVPEPDDHST